MRGFRLALFPFAILACLAVADACASSSGMAPLPPIIAAQCLPLVDYTSAQEKALGDAVAALPAGSPLIGAMTDYGALRSADRACLKP